jgi:hypothetical protein
MAVYFIQAERILSIKIGHTCGDVEIRRKNLQVGCPTKLVTLATIAA